MNLYDSNLKGLALLCDAAFEIPDWVPEPKPRSLSLLQELDRADCATVEFFLRRCGYSIEKYPANDAHPDSSDHQPEKWSWSASSFHPRNRTAYSCWFECTSDALSDLREQYEDEDLLIVFKDEKLTLRAHLDSQNAAEVA